MDTNKLIENTKEAGTLVGISTGLGFLTKKMMKKSVTNDPSSSLMNAVLWVAVMVVSIYTRDYLIKEKLIPS